MKKVLLSSVVAISLLSTNLSANESESYFGIKNGTLDFDKKIIANISGLENTGPYKNYEETKLTGIEYKKFKPFEESSFIWGFGFELLANEGDLEEGGVLSADMSLGYKMDSFKLYGSFGVAIQSLSSYTLAKGNFVSMGISYDLLEKLSLNIEYSKYTMTTSVSDEDEDHSDNQDYEAKGTFVGLAYKF